MKYKTIIIYGGSSEIAPHLIDEFKNECEKIILFVRNNENQILKKIIDDDAEKKISYNVVELSNLSMNLEILSKIKDSISGLIWISGFTGQPLKEYDDKELLSKNLNINFFNPVILINEISKKIIKNSNSFISVFTSVAGLRGRKKQLFYGSAKSGMISYLSGLRQKLDNDNILVQTVIPGYMNTKPFRDGGWKAPSFLITEPKKVARILKKGVRNKKNIIYINIFWKIIMTTINFIPENIFKKMKF
jgi:decaprenylphospho-beta-D-erythro-pentofuranosid-2-ulose 2-reductase